MIRKSSILFILFYFFSCSDSYELSVNLESDQKIFFVFNNDTTYPESSFTKMIDIKNDRFQITKIKYIPIKKWDTEFSSEQISVWGQAQVNIEVNKSSGFLSSSEIIFEQSIQHFYNPNIVNITSSQENFLRKINPDLDTGLGEGLINNSFNWNSLSNIELKSDIESESNFKHTLVTKFSPDIRNHFNISGLNDITKRFVDGRTQLFTSDLSKCTAIFPHNSEIMDALSN